METAIMPEYITVLIKDDKLYKKMKMKYAECSARGFTHFVLENTVFGKSAEWDVAFVKYLFQFVDGERSKRKLRTYNLEKKKWVR